MNTKTQGKCVGCGKEYLPSKGQAHLLGCSETQKLLSSKPKTSEGYLMRVSWAEIPNMYWMFIAVPKRISLGTLDEFLRDVWLECCGHLSEFFINGQEYISHAESGRPSKCMKKPLEELISVGMEIDYLYDFGSSTELSLKVLESLENCPQSKITVLMENEPPSFSCELCQKPAQVICSMCGGVTCRRCEKKHSCVIEEADTYMLMSLVNSPRTGVCGYE